MKAAVLEEPILEFGGEGDTWIRASAWFLTAPPTSAPAGLPRPFASVSSETPLA